MFNRQFAFIPLTFALLLMSYSEPQKQTEAIDECAGVVQEQLAAIAAEISQQHEPAIVTEYLKYYCEGFQAQQEAEINGFVNLVIGFESDEGKQLADLFEGAFAQGASAGYRSIASIGEPDQ